MKRLLAYCESVTNGVTNDDVAAIQDQGITRQNSHYILPSDHKLVWAYGCGLDLNRVRLNYPSLRRLFLPFLRPLDNVDLPPDLAHVAFFDDQSLIIAGNEELAVEATQDNVAPQVVTVLLGVDDGTQITVPGPAFTIRATMSITAVQNAWVVGDLTFSETLPAGNYSVVGMEVIGSTVRAGRLVLPESNHRPGVPGMADNGGHINDRFRMGRLGEFGRFSNTALPQVEILANAAGAITPTVFLDLVKL